MQATPYPSPPCPQVRADMKAQDLELLHVRDVLAAAEAQRAEVLALRDAWSMARQLLAAGLVVSACSLYFIQDFPTGYWDPYFLEV